MVGSGRSRIGVDQDEVSILVRCAAILETGVVSRKTAFSGVAAVASNDVCAAGDDFGVGTVMCIINGWQTRITTPTTFWVQAGDGSG